MDASSVASKTALMVCAYRARATARPDPICEDPWAAMLAGDEGAALATAFDARFPHMEMWLALRVAFLDALVRHCTEGPDVIQQVVILGAGLDTRAARLARDGVRFFEVDHPATQADKRARLARLAGYPLDAPRFVAVDFESGADFVDELARAGLDRTRPAVVVWEGVVPYLTEAAVRATARRVATALHPRSILAFDLVGKRMVQGLANREKDRHTADYVAGLGEPIRFGTNDILPLLADEGFRQVRVHSFDELALAATGTYDRAREFRFQSIAVASVTPFRFAP
jgi:methyltransferase (TIGR00027 family)